MSIFYNHQKLINLFTDTIRGSKGEAIYSVEVEADMILFLTVVDNENFALLELKSSGGALIFEVEVEGLREISSDHTSVNFYKVGKDAPSLTVQIRPHVSLQCEAE